MLKHRAHLISNRKITFQLSLLKQELDHPITEPNLLLSAVPSICSTFHMPWELNSHQSHKGMSWASAVGRGSLKMESNSYLALPGKMPLL